MTTNRIRNDMIWLPSSPPLRERGVMIRLKGLDRKMAPRSARMGPATEKISVTKPRI